jgi:hypothetical protein
MFWEEKYVPYTQTAQDIERLGCASHSDFQSEREKVLDELVSMLIESCSENYEPNGMGCKCCPFLIVYDDGLQCAVKELRQKAGEL